MTPRLRKSLIHDVSKSHESNLGPPVLFSNQLIRKMLSLANVGKDDVFYDLGSGWGQNMIVALTEFGVRKAVGVELDAERISVAEKRLKRLARMDKTLGEWLFYEGDFNDLFEEDFKDEDIDLGEASVVFYGLDPGKKILMGLDRKMKNGARLLIYYLCLFPEIMPVKRDYPFFLSVKPFKRTKSAVEWLSFIVDKQKSSLHKSAAPDEEELWDELAHDYDVDSEYPSIKEYRRRIGEIVRGQSQYRTRYRR